MVTGTSSSDPARSTSRTSVDPAGWDVTARDNSSAMWTGTHLQLTVMSIEPGGEIGLEVHPDRDQFLRVEAGTGRVRMGPKRDRLTFERDVTADWVILVPAGSWHNVVNTGAEPLKLYSLYAPPEHPAGTVHPTQQDAEAAEAAAEHG